MRFEHKCFVCLTTTMGLSNARFRARKCTHIKCATQQSKRNRLASWTTRLWHFRRQLNRFEIFTVEPAALAIKGTMSFQRYKSLRKTGNQQMRCVFKDKRNKKRARLLQQSENLWKRGSNRRVSKSEISDTWFEFSNTATNRRIRWNVFRAKVNTVDMTFQWEPVLASIHAYGRACYWNMSWSGRQR